MQTVGKITLFLTDMNNYWKTLVVLSSLIGAVTNF